MNKPLISVCMLCYNHEKFVAESIQSILNQTYDNWELIIVDNASTDNSKEIIERLVKNDTRVTFLPQTSNKYVSNGINIAMKRSNGAYIALISADDFFVSTKLEQQVGYMLDKNLDLSFTWVNVVNSVSENADASTIKWFNKSSAKHAIEILREFFTMHTVTYAPTAMIRKNILNEIGFHDHRLLQTQDLELWIRILAKTQKVEIIHDKLTNYRILDDGGNLSANNSLAKVNRTDIEMLYIWKQLFCMDNALLSKVFECEITEENKYLTIYKYANKYDIHTRQLAVILELFDSLGAACNIESPSFQFFFDAYGKVGVTNHEILSQKENQIIWLEKQLENYQQTLKGKEEGILWLQDQLKSHQAFLEEQQGHVKELESALKYKGTFKWFVNKILGRA